MVTTAHDLQRERILAAVRLTAVADAAGVAPVAWASTTSPRVLVGDAAGYLAGLHRGRLPAVEVFQASDEWSHLSVGGGTIDTVWVLRAHAPDLTKAAAESRARGILLVALASLRADEYLREGGEEFGALVSGPLGHSLEVRITLVHSYCRSTYETDAVITPAPPPPAPAPPATDHEAMADETVSGGRVVYPGPGWRYASHDNPAHADVPLAVTTGAIMAGAVGAARLYGTMSDPAWNWPAPCVLWLGANGTLTPVLPVGGFLREVARAIDPNTIMIEPEHPVTLL